MLGWGLEAGVWLWKFRTGSVPDIEGRCDLCGYWTGEYGKGYEWGY